MADYLATFVDQLLGMSLTVSPWLWLGLVAAGLIRAFVPAALLRRYLGRSGVRSVVRAALIGTPLPLCSCSVIPTAIGLRRAGASRGATVSFLIATPENGADSFVLSYALLGPFMMIVRPIAAIVSAVIAGVSTELLTKRASSPLPVAADCPQCDEDHCCSQDNASASAPGGGIVDRLVTAARTVLEVLDDIVLLLVIGILVAAVIGTFVPADALIGWASGFPAMLAMLVVGLPMYICATASTPVAAAMIIAGISPGTVLVFLLAGPATNIATMGAIRRELGGPALGTYLGSIAVGAVGFGLLTDATAAWWGIDIAGQAHACAHHAVLPAWLSWLSLVALAVASIRPLRRLFIR